MFSRQIQHWKSSVQGSLGRFLSEQIEFQEKDTHLEKLKRMKASSNADSWRASATTFVPLNSNHDQKIQFGEMDQYSNVFYSLSLHIANV